MTVVYDDPFTRSECLFNCTSDWSDLSDKLRDVFRHTLQEADLSELAPYSVSYNHISFVRDILLMLTLLTRFYDCSV